LWHNILDTQEHVCYIANNKKEVLINYSYVLVIEKRTIEKPSCVSTGTKSIPDYEPPRSLSSKLKEKLKFRK